MELQFKRRLADLRDRANAGRIAAAGVATDVFLATSGKLDGAFGEVHRACATNCSDFAVLYGQFSEALASSKDSSKSTIDELAEACRAAEQKLAALEAETRNIAKQR